MQAHHAWSAHTTIFWAPTGPMLSPRVPNLVPIPGPRMERETPGQRTRPNYGHPQAKNPGRLYRGDRFSCSMPAPATSSRHLYTGHHRGHIQAAPRLRAHRGEPLSRDHPQIPVSMPSLFRFDASSNRSHMFVFSSHTRPAHSETSTAALTTPALDRRSLRWFGISACTATPQDLPPSLAQHGSCRRSSTSSSLPFRTHVGAENCVVVRWD